MESFKDQLRFQQTVKQLDGYILVMWMGNIQQF